MSLCCQIPWQHKHRFRTGPIPVSSPPPHSPRFIFPLPFLVLIVFYPSSLSQPWLSLFYFLCCPAQWFTATGNEMSFMQSVSGCLPGPYIVSWELLCYCWHDTSLMVGLTTEETQCWFKSGPTPTIKQHRFNIWWSRFTPIRGRGNCWIRFTQGNQRFSKLWWLTAIPTPQFEKCSCV